MILSPQFTGSQMQPGVVQGQGVIAAGPQGQLQMILSPQVTGSQMQPRCCAGRGCYCSWYTRTITNDLITTVDWFSDAARCCAATGCCSNWPTTSRKFPRNKTIPIYSTRCTLMNQNNRWLELKNC